MLNQESASRNRTTALALAAVVLVAIAVIAVRSSDSNAAEPSGPADRAIEISPELLYDLRTADPATMSEETLQFAVEMDMYSERKVAQCMTSLGYAYQPASEATVAAERTFVDSQLSEEVAASTGYGITFERTGATTSFDQNSSREFIDALLSPSGCMAGGQSVNRQVDAIFASYQEPLSKLMQDAASDARVVAAEQHWTQCMSAAGFDFESSQDLQQSIQNKLDVSKSASSVEDLQEYERSAAIADVGCSQELNKARTSVLQQAFDEFHEAHRDEILDQLASVIVE